MKIAIIGSRNPGNIDFEMLLAEYSISIKSDDIIISGGAKGIDSLAASFALKNGNQLLEFLPDYSKFGRGAPLVRNKQIIDNADVVIAFWNHESRGTKFTIDYARKSGKEPIVIAI